MSETSIDAEINLQSENEPITFRGRPLNNKPVFGPIKGLIHGVNGSRKTTFFSQMPNPCLADTDGNAETTPNKKFVPDVSNFTKERIKTFPEILSLVDDLINDNHNFKSFGIDTLSTLNTLCLEHVRGNYKGDKEKLSTYGTDYKLCAMEMMNLCKKLDELRDKKRMHVVLLSQTKLVTVHDPIVKIFTRWEPDVNEATARIFLDWASFVFYARKPLDFKDDEQAKKGTATKGSKIRVMPIDIGDHLLYTDGNAGYCAKNVYNLPSIIETDWKIVAEYIKNYFDENK